MNGGLITDDDLAQYRAIERKPVSARYRGHVLYTGGPPVGAGVSLLEALQILGNYEPAAAAPRSARDADYWHYLIESWKVRDRITRIADPGAVGGRLRRTPAAGARRRAVRAASSRDTAARFSEDSEEVGRRSGAHRQRHERVRHRRCRRQHDRGDADAEHVGRIVLRDARARVPLQQPPALEPHDARRLRAADAAGCDRTPRTCRCWRSASQDGQPVPRVRGRRRPATRGSRRPPIRSSTAVVDGGLSMQQAIEAPRFLVDARSRRSDRHRRARRDRGSLPARRSCRI